MPTTDQWAKPTPTLEGVESRHYPALEISAPSWFERADFVAFLNGERQHQNGVQPATWHQKGDEAGDFSDVFVTFDSCDGSDMRDLPEDIWEAICYLCSVRAYTYAIVKISPV